MHTRVHARMPAFGGVQALALAGSGPSGGAQLYEGGSGLAVVGNATSSVSSLSVRRTARHGTARYLYCAALPRGT